MWIFNHFDLPLPPIILPNIHIQPQDQHVLLQRIALLQPNPPLNQPNHHPAQRNLHVQPLAILPIQPNQQNPNHPAEQPRRRSTRKTRPPKGYGFDE